MFKFTQILKQNSAVLATPFMLVALNVYPSTTAAQTVPTPTSPSSGCQSGYPDRTDRGDHPMTRYEFAAGMNACMNSVNQVVQFNRANYATKADLEVLIQRQRELNQQIRELNDRLAPPSESQPGQTE